MVTDGGHTEGTEDCTNAKRKARGKTKGDKDETRGQGRTYTTITCADNINRNNSIMQEEGLGVVLALLDVVAAEDLNLAQILLFLPHHEVRLAEQLILVVF